MKAVIYARYSSDSQREESIEGQLRECKEYAERNGITVLSTYIDRALSAKTDNRPDFQRMIKDSANGLFDIVLVWKLDRFARNRYDSAHYKAILKKNGVKVVSAKEAIAEDSTGILLESLLEEYAEFYSVELSEKIHRGQKENALKGLNNGGGIPLGYVLGSDKRLAVDPMTAPVVLEIFTRYADGETVRAIVESLNERGLQTKHNKPYSLGSFNAILKNRKYIGEYRYQDVVIPGGVPAIVPQELFDRVQARIARNKRAPAMSKADETFLLTTKLFCGKCGRLMVGESGTSHTGKKHYYYKCGSAKRKTGCTKKAVKKDWIENLVVERTMQMIFDDTTLDAIASMVLDVQARENTSLPVLKAQLAQTEQGIQNMLNAIQQGIFTVSTKQRLEELEATKEQLTVSILQEELQKPHLSKEQILFFLQRFRAIDTTKQEQRQRLIDSFVNAVYVYDDKIILTFNYQDGTETITLGQYKRFGFGSRVSTIQNRDKRFYLSSLFCSILPGNTKQLSAVFGCNPFNLCGTYALDFRDSLSHAMHIQRGITAAAKRLGCHVGRIGLDHQSLNRHFANDFLRLFGIFECDNTGKRQIIAEFQQFACHFDVAGIAVVHADHIRIPTGDLHAVGVRIAVMHDDREVQCTRQLHLAGKYNLLPRTRTLVFFPVIVKPNFADGANLAFVLCQCADGLQISLPAVLDVLRVNTDRCIYKWIFIRVADRLARAFHITAGIENQADIVLGHGSQQRIAVLVEPFIVIVCMCIKKHSKPSSNPVEMPAGVPKSVLIHVGCDVIRFLLERGAGIAHRNRQPSLTEHADVVHAVAKHYNILIRNG